MNNNIKIRLSVDNFYDNISKNKQKTKIDPKQLSKSLGYDEKIINEFPDEINMGLSCGNPINHLKIKEPSLLPAKTDTVFLFYIGLINILS